MPSPQNPAARDSLWLRSYRVVEAPAARLVCFPHAGGAASFFRPVPFALRAPDRVETFALQYPGRQDRRREPPIVDLDTLADQADRALAGLSDLPLVLFGHSMGAVVAFEVARRREAAGRPVAHLVVSGRRGPEAAADPGKGVPALDDASIIAEIRKLEGSASAVLGDPELMAAMLPALRADYQAIRDHRTEPGATVGCPITALTGDQDPKTSVAEVEEWARHTTGAFDLHVFPGGHFYLVDRMAGVVDILDGLLAGLVGRPAPSAAAG